MSVSYLFGCTTFDGCVQAKPPHRGHGRVVMMFPTPPPPPTGMYRLSRLSLCAVVQRGRRVVVSSMEWKALNGMVKSKEEEIVKKIETWFRVRR